ncbi:hypothetical protein CYMTET_54394 [Cymbomonas tetramitiformis]|uniref:Uncharacterized protein n=1 Tax=Cymbomonas tetramitiformis TaxID=36881 RepID=A0AAE0BGF2_9CHLO|nr:hypothetical protein CYMTET_54394 [Cymbomonas tetramitiformis]
MSSAAKWGKLEVFKFAIYLSIPAVMTFGVARVPERIDYLTQKMNYVEYPPEGEKPPTNEELHKALAPEKKSSKWF